MLRTNAVICGGGIVGVAIARALAMKGLGCILLESLPQFELFLFCLLA